MSQDNWKRIYPNAREKLEGNISVSLVKPLQLWVEFDSDHAHDLETRRSITAVLVFLNNTPFKWYCKKQATVDTSTHGAELNACKTAGEIVGELRFKLRHDCDY